MNYCEGDLSWEDRSDNSTGSIHECRTSPSLAEALLLYFQKWQLKVWQALFPDISSQILKKLPV